MVGYVFSFYTQIYKKLGIEDSLLHPMRSYRHRQIMQVLSLGMNQQVDNFFIKLITYFSQPPVSLSNIYFRFWVQGFTHFLISINFIQYVSKLQRPTGFEPALPSYRGYLYQNIFFSYSSIGFLLGKIHFNYSYIRQVYS